MPTLPAPAMVLTNCRVELIVGAMHQRLVRRLPIRTIPLWRAKSGDLAPATPIDYLLYA